DGGDPQGAARGDAPEREDGREAAAKFYRAPRGGCGAAGALERPRAPGVPDDRAGAEREGHRRGAVPEPQDGGDAQGTFEAEAEPVEQQRPAALCDRGAAAVAGGVT